MAANKAKYTPFNRNIDSLLLSNPVLHANKAWLHRQIFTYLAEIDTGATPKELGLSKKRKLAKPTSLIFSKTGTIKSGLFDAQPGEEDTAFKLAHLKLQGVMRLQGGLSTRGVDSLIKDIRRANNSGEFSGIFLEVNSGGGESLAGQELKNALIDSKLPVYTFGQVIGSAALHGTLPSKKIFLSGKGSEMGSIGSMLTVDKSFIKFYNKNFIDIYSKTSPEKNIEFRQLLKGNTELLQDYVTENDKLFMDAVQEFRNLPEDTKQSTLKGKMFTAEEAVARGLADGILTFDQTLQAIASDLNNATVGSDNNFNSSLNKSKMNISIVSDTWKSLVSNITRITGKQVAEDIKPDALVTELESVQSLPDFKNTVIAEATTAINEQMKGLTDNVNSLQKTIENLNSEITTLKEANSNSELQSDIDKLNNEIVNLKQSNETLVATNKDLVSQIAALNGTPATDGMQGAASIDTSVGKFNTNLKNITVTNEAKYSS